MLRILRTFHAYFVSHDGEWRVWGQTPLTGLRMSGVKNPRYSETRRAQLGCGGGSCRPDCGGFTVTGDPHRET